MNPTKRTLVLAALAAQDFTAASKSALDLSRSCNDCHDAHKPFQ